MEFVNKTTAKVYDDIEIRLGNKIVLSINERLDFDILYKRIEKLKEKHNIIVYAYYYRVPNEGNFEYNVILAENVNSSAGLKKEIEKIYYIEK